MSRIELLWLVQYQLLLFNLRDDGAIMKHKVYTVFDSKALVYMQPFYMRADGEAIRAFRMSIGKPGHTFSDYPADYTLFAIGEYDDDNGRFTQYDVFSNLGNGVQFLPEGEK